MSVGNVHIIRLLCSVAFPSLRVVIGLAFTLKFVSGSFDLIKRFLSFLKKTRSHNIDVNFIILSFEVFLLFVYFLFCLLI